MPMRHGLFVIVVLAAAASLSVAQIKVGDRFTPPKADRLAGTRLKSLAELKGRLVLWIWVDLGDPSSRELVARIHHLDAPFGKKGFVPVLVTGAGRDAVDAFRDATGLKTPIALEAGLKSHAALGFSGFPVAALVAPDGVVAWVGHPKDVTRDDLELLLRKVKTATPIDRRLGAKIEVPKAFAAAAKDAADGRLGAAYLALAGGDGLSEVDRMLLEEARRVVDALLDFELGCAERADETKRFAEAGRLYARIARDFEGHPRAAAAKTRAEEIAKDPAATAEREAAARLAEIDRLVGRNRRKDALALARELAASPLATTKAVKDRDLKALVASLEN